MAYLEDDAATFGLYIFLKVALMFNLEKLNELKIGGILRPLCEIFDAFHAITI